MSWKGSPFKPILNSFCIIECLAATNIYLECDLDMDLKKDPKLGLQTLRYNENTPTFVMQQWTLMAKCTFWFSNQFVVLFKSIHV
jgi:hypothetical protein